MRSLRSIRLFAILALSAPSLTAQQRFSLEHLRRIVGVSGVELSPDGRIAVVTVSRPNFENDKYDQELYTVNVATGATHQLTFDRTHVSSPQFSPDGRTLAFLAQDSADRSQIWLLPINGGEARRLTSHVTGIEHYAWRPDGSEIAFASADSAPKQAGEGRHLTTFHVGDQDLFLREAIQPQHIWVVSANEGTPRRLTHGPWTLEFVLPPGSSPSSLSWSKDGKTIAFAQVVAPQSGKLDSVHVALLDVATVLSRPHGGSRITPCSRLTRARSPIGIRAMAAVIWATRTRSGSHRPLAVRHAASLTR